MYLNINSGCSVCRMYLSTKHTIRSHATKKPNWGAIKRETVPDASLQGTLSCRIIRETYTTPPQQQYKPPKQDPGGQAEPPRSQRTLWTDPVTPFPGLTKRLLRSDCCQQARSSIARGRTSPVAQYLQRDTRGAGDLRRGYFCGVFDASVARTAGHPRTPKRR